MLTCCINYQRDRLKAISLPLGVLAASYILSLAHPM